MNYLNRTLIIVRPTIEFVNWVNSVDQTAEDEVTLEDVHMDLSTFLIPEVADDDEFEVYLYNCYEVIFEDALAGWYDDPSVWPEITYDRFLEWFDIDMSTMIADLTDEPIILEEI